MAGIADLIKAIAAIGDAVTSRFANYTPPATVGDSKPWWSDTAPTGWLFMHGQTLNVADYPTLASILGNKYGGDGTTTFALPDTRGRSLRGTNSDAPGMNTIALADKAGADSINLSASQLPSHAHSAGSLAVTPHVKLNATNTNPLTIPTASNKYVGASPGGQGAANIYGDSADADAIDMGGVTADISGNTGTAGTGASVTITNPYVACNWIIAATGVTPPGF